MALLNRPSIHDNLYDSKGRLQGGLSALEDLAQVIQLNGTSDGEDKSGGETTDDGSGGSEDEMSDIEPALELPISGMGGGGRVGSHGDTPSIGSSDMSDSPGSSDDDEDVGRMEEISMGDEPAASTGAGGAEKGKAGGLKVDTDLGARAAGEPVNDATLTASPTVMTTNETKVDNGTGEESNNPKEANAETDQDVNMGAVPSEHDENALTPQASRTPKTPNSRRSSRKTTMQDSLSESAPDLSQTPGSKLKRLFLDLEILPTLLVRLVAPLPRHFRADYGHTGVCPHIGPVLRVQVEQLSAQRGV